MILGVIPSGSRPPQQNPKPAEQAPPPETTTNEADPSAPASGGTNEAGAPPPAQPASEPAAAPPAPRPDAAAGPQGDDVRRGSVAQALAEAEPSRIERSVEAPVTAGARVETPADPEAEEAEALRGAEAAVEAARVSASLERVSAPDEAPTGPPPARIPYGPGSAYEAATSATPDAARGTMAVDRAI